jgi:hypothetical protein
MLPKGSADAGLLASLLATRDAPKPAPVRAVAPPPPAPDYDGH